MTMFKKLLLPLVLWEARVLAEDEDELGIPFHIVNTLPEDEYYNVTASRYIDTLWGTRANAIAVAGYYYEQLIIQEVLFTLTTDGILQGNDSDSKVEVTSPGGRLTYREENEGTPGFSLDLNDQPALLLDGATPTIWICPSGNTPEVHIYDESPGDDCLEYLVSVQLQEPGTIDPPGDGDDGPGDGDDGPGDGGDGPGEGDDGPGGGDDGPGEGDDGQGGGSGGASGGGDDEDDTTTTTSSSTTSSPTTSPTTSTTSATGTSTPTSAPVTTTSVPTTSSPEATNAGGAANLVGPNGLSGLIGGVAIALLI